MSREQAFRDRYEGMVINIYKEGMNCISDLERARSDLASARKAELEAWQAHRDAVERYEEEEAAALYALAQDKDAHGPNDRSRKINEANMLRNQKNSGGRLHLAWLELLTATEAYEGAKTLTQTCLDDLSAARNKARVIQGLGNMLWGHEHE